MQKDSLPSKLSLQMPQTTKSPVQSVSNNARHPFYHLDSVGINENAVALFKGIKVEFGLHLFHCGVQLLLNFRSKRERIMSSNNFSK